ncbi:hypothetical protein ELOC111193_18050 [Elizabethkingia occulta]
MTINPKAIQAVVIKTGAILIGTGLLAVLYISFTAC